MGIKGWNDNDMPMIDAGNKEVDIDTADEWLNRAVTEEKRQPNL
jgi:hypothetical protein